MIISPKHPWEKLPDDQYLVMIGAAARTESGVRPTAAGLLMFGDEYHIVREFPEYFLDYRQYDFTSEIDWIDRVYSSTGTWSEIYMISSGECFRSSMKVLRLLSSLR